MKQVITSVEEGSIGQELGLEKGDAILSINGESIEDVLDYHYLSENSSLTLEILTKDGEVVTCQVDKEEDEPLGLSFEEEFMGQYLHCKNHCVFCFIDQLPKGMRPSLYFKDDDARLSFIYGNYITMTNMLEKDFEKIIRYRMEPINISIHATDPEVRRKMLKNPRAGELMERLRRLKEEDILMNGQIVLCKGYNDKEVLDRTIRDLMALMPQLQSVSIVPVGLTKHRQGLAPLEPFTAAECEAVIRQVEPYQREALERYGTHFIHVSDEFYIKAGWPIPPAETYDGYLQLENGVGMVRLFLDETDEAIEALDPKEYIDQPPLTVSFISGTLVFPYIERQFQKLSQKLPFLTVKAYPIVNDFFGPEITVSGLLTGQDILRQLKGRDLGDKLLLSQDLLKADEEIFLDDMPLEELKKALHTPVTIVKSSGESFIDDILKGCTQ